LQKIENENRLLQIGIIGRVKTGKSSLLNAILFDGKSILPKAATPMTAALTVISYGKKLSAEVEFFSRKDIEKIKKEHAEYERELKILTQIKFDELKKRKAKKGQKADGILKVGGILNKSLSLTPAAEKDLREKAERSAKRELNSKVSLNSAYDQYNRIKKSGVNYTTLGNKKILVASSLSDLSNNLLEYVGAAGKYMPFTKSVHIKIPQENLKNIQVVDTPGMNDPVQSREERTRELLKFCDVVLIVSPSGQFLSNEDVELMDRITSKEGIRELYVVASQMDLQLFGSVKEESGGDLHRAFKLITSDLAKHLHSTLSELKQSNIEVGTTYDQLIEQSREKVIHSSGICLTIKEEFDNQTNWDEGTQTAWENLTSHYPDYFSGTDKVLSSSNLDLLANTSSINSIIEEVKEKKDEILRSRREEFVKAKLDSLLAYKKALIKYIDDQVEIIHNSDVEELKEQQQRLHKIKAKTSSGLDEEYHDLVTELGINLNEPLKQTVKEYFKQAKRAVNDAEGSKTKSYEVSTSKWYNPFSWGRKETKYDTYTTVRTGAAKNALEELTGEIETAIDMESKQLLLNWKNKHLYSQILTTLRGENNINDEHIEITQIKKVIRNVLNSVVYPDISYSGKLPDSLSSATGTLKRSSAEDFLEEARSYISELRQRVREDISSYSSSLVSALKDVNLSESIFSNYNTMLEELETKIKNKAITLDSFDRLKKQLEKIN
jgi:hypothetical protein